MAELIVRFHLSPKSFLLWLQKQNGLGALLARSITAQLKLRKRVCAIGAQFISLPTFLR